MKIIIINGPNLNLTGKREPEIYGSTTFPEYITHLQEIFKDHQIEYFQSNIEGVLIDKLHEVGFSYDGIILNPGGYSHTSIALADAIKGIITPVIEVHLSNIASRESYRHNSYTAANCVGIISGLGMFGYNAAISFLLNR
ncbi:MAG: type II 3-dehydroquinate dehydratase [Bacteroidota bacterium]